MEQGNASGEFFLQGPSDQLRNEITLQVKSLDLNSLVALAIFLENCLRARHQEHPAYQYVVQPGRGQDPSCEYLYCSQFEHLISGGLVYVPAGYWQARDCLPLEKLLLSTSLCVGSPVLHLQALVDSGDQDSLLDEELGAQAGCTMNPLPYPFTVTISLHPGQPQDYPSHSHHAWKQFYAIIIPRHFSTQKRL